MLSTKERFKCTVYFKLLYALIYTGIEVTLPDGVKKKSKVMAISGHFDLPARAGVLEQVTYVGHDSCSFCDEHGDVVKTTGRGHVMTFPFRNTPSGHAEPRDAVNVKAHAYEALEKNATVSYLCYSYCKLQSHSSICI